MAQADYFAVHRYMIIEGVVIPDLVEWPDLKTDVPTTDVTTDAMVTFPIPTGVKKLEKLSFTFNRTKLPTSADIYFKTWENVGGLRQILIVETDAQGDPFDPTSVSAQYDLDKCQLGSVSFPGGNKESPVSAKVIVEITPRQISKR